MPRGEDVETAETAYLRFLVVLFLVAPRALTFLLFFTRLPSSFKNVAAANPEKYNLLTFRASLVAAADPAFRGIKTTYDLQRVRAFPFHKLILMNSSSSTANRTPSPARP